MKKLLTAAILSCIASFAMAQKPNIPEEYQGVWMTENGEERTILQEGDAETLGRPDECKRSEGYMNQMDLIQGKDIIKQIRKKQAEWEADEREDNDDDADQQNESENSNIGTLSLIEKLIDGYGKKYYQLQYALGCSSDGLETIVFLNDKVGFLILSADDDYYSIILKKPR